MSSRSSARSGGLRRIVPWLCAAAVVTAFVGGALAPSTDDVDPGVTWTLGGVVILLTLVAAVVADRAGAVDRATIRRLTEQRDELAVRSESAERALDVLVGQQLPAFLAEEPAPRLPALPPAVRASLEQAAAALEHARTESAARRDAVEVAVVALARKVQASAHRIQEEAERMVQRHPADPDVLQTSMRVDHAAAQHARMAQSLATLCGQSPGQQWSEALPLPDVVKGAAGRITAFHRVEVSGDPGVAVTARVVEPLMHLLAELLANATQSSPPGTPVLVVLRHVQRGAAIEIDDGGVGIDRQQLGRIDEIASGRRVVTIADLGAIPQTGLAVVGTYARRHGFRVEITESVYGGLRAVVLVPGELVEQVVTPEVPASDDAWAAALAPADLAPAARAAVTADQASRPHTGTALPPLPQRRSRRAEAVTSPTPSAAGVVHTQTAAEAGAWMEAFFGAPSTPDAPSGADDAPHHSIEPSGQDGEGPEDR